MQQTLQLLHQCVQELKHCDGAHLFQVQKKKHVFYYLFWHSAAELARVITSKKVVFKTCSA